MFICTFIYVIFSNTDHFNVGKHPLYHWDSQHLLWDGSNDLLGQDMTGKINKLPSDVM